MISSVEVFFGVGSGILLKQLTEESMLMRFDIQTTRKLTVSAVGVSFLTLWAVVLGCAQPLSLTSRAAKLEDGASVKKGREPNAAPGADKLGAKDSRSTEEKASHSQADPDSH